LFDAHTGNGHLELIVLALLGLASLALGWVTRRPVWSLLVVVVIAFGVPFGSQDPPVYHEAAITVVYAGMIGIASAVLIVISAVAGLFVDDRSGLHRRLN
jgi:hypothetical protein